MTDLAAAAEDYEDALDDLDQAVKARVAAHAAHVATIPFIGRVRVGNGSDATRKAHHAACERSAVALTALHHARDRLVHAALVHTDKGAP